MARVRTVFRCTECGAAAPQWVGRCPGCEEWNTLEEEVQTPALVAVPAGPLDAAVPIVSLPPEDHQVRPTGVVELDRVLGGGLVPGSVTLVGGEPGIGKSTLLLQAAASVAAAAGPVLYVSAEESRAQVRLRAERLGTLRPELWLASETTLPSILAQVDAVRPTLLVVDSIQAVADPEVGSSPGSVTQVRACAQQLVVEAKKRGLAVVLVGHVTKDGSLAGPRALEHVVDTVLSFEGDRHHGLRLLRAVKHRFGSTQDLGVLEMGDAGLASVPDPSHLFLADRRTDVPGSVVVPTIEGHRPLLVELQALVVRSTLPSPRRSAQGLDSGRLGMLLAVLHRHVGLATNELDVYALAVGGARVVEPAADLALVLAVASAAANLVVPAATVACAEVGLAGELRQVGQTERRLAEAARLGFTRALLPPLAPDPPAGMSAVRVGTVAEAVAAAGLLLEV